MLKILYSIATILCTTKFLGIDATVKLQSKTYIFPGKEVIFGYASYDDDKLTYAICDEIGKSGERNCKLTREKTAYSDDTYTCNITLNLDHRQENSSPDTDRISVIPFLNNKAILYQAEQGKNSNVKISTVKLDDCTVAENEILITNPMRNAFYAVIVTPYEGSYDVIYKNSNSCGAKGRCKLTIDATGKIIEGPANTTQAPLSLSHFPYVAAINPKYRDNGTFYFESVDGCLMEFGAVIHKPDGSKRTLGKYKAYMPMPIVKSTSNNFLSVCYRETVLKYNCIQYDNDGNVKFEMDPIKYYNRTDVTFIYNLPTGGLLAFAGKCDKRYCEFDDVQFIIIKVDSAGKIVGSLNIGALKVESGTSDIKIVNSMYIDSDNNYCLSLAYYRSAEYRSMNGTIEASTRCFTDQDLSASVNS